MRWSVLDCCGRYEIDFGPCSRFWAMQHSFWAVQHSFWAVVRASSMHSFRASALMPRAWRHGRTAIYDACHPYKQWMVPYFGSGVCVLDLSMSVWG